MEFKIAKETLELEAKAVKDQIKHLDANFGKAVRLIKDCKGRVIVMGLGKSGLIGRKISATMSSIGIPSIFVHPSESLHGDLGSLMAGDVVIMLSYSGETEEIKKVLPVLKNMKIKVIVMTGKTKANVWQNSDCIIDCSVEKEACPYNMAPTSSTTAVLAMGDALALTVSNLKGFKREHLALLHPLGSIGKRLTMHVSDIMRKGKQNPVVFSDATVEDALLVMTGTRVGATSVVDKKGKITGFFTDGDLRRRLQKDEKILKKKITEVMTKNPRTVTPDMMAVDAARVLKDYNIDNIPVVDKNNKPLGILDQGDLLSQGIAE
ncbi:KpsF/GutQ family sugar-phosphate isomerase [Endomicrobium proavitum]|uniref:Putative phosphosugar isomerase n=1 Tax=Endomicrobium proavitum TaxID=1408281 RepID=A0A0G3WIT9_9BACT|nr:KpsF/GutQ family sugar-phosphate isomerase [Endomicrobium proavitum]AKL97805.1 putative phosphosugar isomerase [Endomicrobium proavitum]